MKGKGKQRIFKKFSYFAYFLAIDQMPLSATSIAAGVTNTAILITIPFIILPRPVTICSSGVNTAVPATIKAMAATKNGVVSFSEMFKKPTIRPNTTRANVMVGAYSATAPEAIPARTAITTPAMNAHSPAFAMSIQNSPIFTLSG